MKIALLALMTFFTASTAMADQAIYDLLEQVNSEVNAADLDALSSSERADIRTNLRSILDVLDGQGGGSGSQSVLCVVSSNHSSYYRLSNGNQEIGADSSRDECRELAQAKVKNLVCGRSLNHGSYFRLYRIRDAGSIGADTNKDTCLRLINGAVKDFVCAVSTNHSSYYSIYNARTGVRTGGDVSLDRCLEDLDLLH